MLQNDLNIFDVVLLFALPASGKSEFRHFLANIDENTLKDQFHFGQTLQLDDFPYVHMMRVIDNELEKLGHKRLFYIADDQPEIDGHIYATLINLINEDYNDLLNRNTISCDSAAKLLFQRIDNASIKANLLPPMQSLPEEIYQQLAINIEQQAKELLDEKHSGYPADFVNKTIVFEASRGGKDKATMPLSDPDGYQFSLRYLSDEILKRAVILYIQVTPEESRRKNFERTDPNDPGSILNHGVPLAVMLNDYGCDDMEYLIETSEVKDTVTVKKNGNVYHIPVAILDNRDDKTTYFRSEPSTWSDDRIKQFTLEVKKVTDKLFSNYHK